MSTVLKGSPAGPGDGSPNIRVHTKMDLASHVASADVIVEFGSF